MSRGQLALVLHAHLPFVRKPQHSRFFEENWLFEAITECYVPLLLSVNRLCEKGIPVKINLSLSPPLMHMLSDKLLIKRYQVHLKELLELIDKELIKYDKNSEQYKLAEFYKKRITTISYSFNQRFKKNLLQAFADLEKLGALELFTCVGSHPYLPLYQTTPEIIRGQIKIAKSEFKRHFGKYPQGIWLPECGYFTGLDDFLAQEKLQYFLMETHGVIASQPNPPYGVFTGISLKNGVTALGRDQSSSKEVWSRQFGYPGNPNYREYYKDLANDVSLEYLGEYFQSADNSINTGLKYYRITGSDEKLPYQPYRALQTVRQDAQKFVENRIGTISRLAPHMDLDPLIVAPFDAELFGHWWFEGNDFIEAMCEEIAANSSIISMTSLTAACQNNSVAGDFKPAISSWGEGGFGGVWVNPENDWMINITYEASKEFIGNVNELKPNKIQKRILNQMARELVMMQASDWAFMIHNNSAKGFAENQFKEHYSHFKKLSILLMQDEVDLSLLKNIESSNNIFKEIDYSWFRKV